MRLRPPIRPALWNGKFLWGAMSQQMSDATESTATKWFQTGSGAIARGDFDYAIKCFDECCKLLPGRLTYRQALRGAQRKKYADNGKGASMASVRSAGSKTKMAYAKNRSKWADVVSAAEEVLGLNPWDVSTLYEEACALHKLEHPLVAIWVLETAQDRKTADVYRKLAELYEETEQFEKAIKAWEWVSKLDPKDESALSKQRQLAASATIQRGKYEDDKKDGDQQTTSRSAAPETFEARLQREVREIEAKLEQDPNNPSLYRDLGENYRKLGNLEKAIEIYSKGVEATAGKDIDLSLRLKEAQVEPYRRKLAEAQPKWDALDKAKDPQKAAEFKANLDKLKASLFKREMEIYRLRIQSNPDDATAHLELGFRHLQFGEYDDAIKELQKGRGDTQRKWEALCHLGNAFWKKKNLALAERNLADALDNVPQNNEDARKQVLYYRGRVAQDAGDNNRALEFFNEIAAIDYEYRDVAKRIDAINSSV